MKRKSYFVWAIVVALTFVIADGRAAAQFNATNLVSDQSGLARYTDPNLLDAWGMAELPGGGFIVADALSGFVTFYSRSGKTLRSPVTVPASPSLPPGTPGSPAGVVANRTSEFVISKDGKSAPALYLFSTLDGMICGWSPEVDPDNAVIIVDNSTRSPIPDSYTDLSMARNKHGQMVLFATDSGISPTQSNNDVEMYDGNFNLLGHFTDPTAPPDKTAYSARPVKGKLYVTYAGFTPNDGGVVDIFDTDGNMLRRFAANSPGGPLEAPYWVVTAPEGFGWASHQLLISEVDSGEISVFNPKTGEFLGALSDTHGNPLIIDGVWATVFAQGSESPELFFAAGCAFPPDYSPSLFGLIKVAQDDGGNREEARNRLAGQKTQTSFRKR